MRDTWSQLMGRPLPVRYAVMSGATFLIIGGFVGLVVGLRHPPTVWFAIPEAAILAGIPAAVLGLAFGLITSACRWVWRGLSRSTDPYA